MLSMSCHCFQIHASVQTGTKLYELYRLMFPRSRIAARSSRDVLEPRVSSCFQDSSGSTRVCVYINLDIKYICIHTHTHTRPHMNCRNCIYGSQYGIILPQILHILFNHARVWSELRQLSRWRENPKALSSRPAVVAAGGVWATLSRPHDSHGHEFGVEGGGGGCRV